MHNGHVPSYRRQGGKGRDKAFVEWKGDRIYLDGKYDSPESWEHYHRFLLENVYTENPPAPRSSEVDPPIVLLVMSYLDFAQGFYPDEKQNSSSEYGHLRRIGSLLVRCYGSEPCREFGPKKLKQFQEALPRMHGDDDEPLNWSRSYINHQVSRLRRIFRWGVSEELVPVGVYESLKTVAPLRAGRTAAREAAKREPVELAAVEATLPYLTPIVDAMVCFQLLTGARSENVCLLRPQEIDREQSPWLWTPPKHKTQHLDVVLRIYIGPQAQAILAPYLDRDAAAFCFSPREDHAWRSERRRAYRKTPLTPSQKSRKRGPSRRLRSHFDSRSYCRSIKAGIARANAARAKQSEETGTEILPLPIWTPHQLRHARSTLIKEHYGIEAAQAVLGHESLDATQIYTRKMVNLARQVVQESG